MFENNQSYNLKKKSEVISDFEVEKSNILDFRD